MKLINIDSVMRFIKPFLEIEKKKDNLVLLENRLL